MVVNLKNGGHFTRFKSKNSVVEKITKKHGMNSKKTTRRETSAIWRIFVELDKPKHTLSKINLTSMLVLGCFSFVFKLRIIFNE